MLTLLDDEKRYLGRRFSKDELHLVCPWHAWEFELESGRCAADPSLSLRKFPVKVEGDRVLSSFDMPGRKAAAAACLSTAGMAPGGPQIADLNTPLTPTEVAPV